MEHDPGLPSVKSARGVLRVFDGNQAMKIDSQCLGNGQIAVPAYLSRIYWWAYVHPLAVRLFERAWLVNLILWGNFGRLRDSAIDALGAHLAGRTLQIACVYGDLTAKLSERLATGGRLDVVDVLLIQLDNLSRKLPRDVAVRLVHGDSAALAFASGSYDRALLFFLLHEQPEEVRRATIAEALRVLKPGGRLVIVDYHCPGAFNSLYWPVAAILHTLEPFALDLWRHEIAEWFPPDAPITDLRKETSFGGLYQLLTVTV